MFLSWRHALNPFLVLLSLLVFPRGEKFHPAANWAFRRCSAMRPCDDFDRSPANVSCHWCHWCQILLNNYRQKHIVKLKICACAKDFKTTCSFSQIHSCLLYANTLIPYHFCSSVSTKGKRNQWLWRWKIQAMLQTGTKKSAGVKLVWQIWSFQNHQAFRTCDFVWLHQRPSDLTTPTTVVVWVAEVGKR